MTFRGSTFSSAHRPAGRRGLVFVLALYLLANVLIGVFSTPDARLAHAADGSTWYKPALAFATHGKFVNFDDPTKVDTYRPPIYTLFLAFAITVGNEAAPLVTAVAQIALLLLVGLLFRDLVRDWLPGWENIGLALLILNPSVLSSAQYVQSEILFLACTMLAFWASAKYLRSGGQLRFALLTGLSVALACLTRPTAQFLLFVLPVLFPILALATKSTSPKRATVQGLLSMALAFAVLAPWVSFVASQGHGLALSDSAGKYRYVWDQVVMIEAQSAGLSYHEAEAKLIGPGGKQYEFIASQESVWSSMSKPERHKALADAGMAALLSYPVTDFAKALYRSLGQFFFAGGAGNWHNLFGIGSDAATLAWFTTAQNDLRQLLASLLGSIPPAGLAFSAIAIGFTVATRAIGLLGIFSLFDRTRWGLLLVIVGFILYFALIHVFVGNSRYRVAIEPMLMFLVLCGLDSMSRFVFRR